MRSDKFAFYLNTWQRHPPLLLMFHPRPFTPLECGVGYLFHEVGRGSSLGAEVGKRSGTETDP